jgi:N-methylhydantoinase A/oxoprolinase/acetone carboxylase beta subunit
MHWPTSNDWAEAPIYSSAALTPGTSLEGPLVVEGTHTSVVVHPGDRLEVLERGTVSLSIETERQGSWR